MTSLHWLKEYSVIIDKRIQESIMDPKVNLIMMY